MSDVVRMAIDTFLLLYIKGGGCHGNEDGSHGYEVGCHSNEKVGQILKSWSKYHNSIEK